MIKPGDFGHLRDLLKSMEYGAIGPQMAEPGLQQIAGNQVLMSNETTYQNYMALLIWDYGVRVELQSQRERVK